MVGGNSKKVRSVPVYLQYLERAGKSPRTIRTYRDSLDFYARFLGVPLGEIHHHMTVDNLMEYLDSPRMREIKPNSRRTAIVSITRYMKVNGVEFDELEMGIVKVRRTEAREDKPASLELLQKMMDLADVRMKAFVIFLVSTGCRIGESSKLRVSDVNGSVVTIPNEIAKGRRGGRVFLTAEAREYLEIWLKARDQWIREANVRTFNIKKRRPDNDQRLFASSIPSLSKEFQTLYKKADGESTKILRGTRSMITPHSLRAYFRTHAAGPMGVDLVEGIMRHTGYLNAAYVRMTDEERERLFHEGEHALYITRRDQRVSDFAQEVMQQKQKKMEEELEFLRAKLEKEILDRQAGKS